MKKTRVICAAVLMAGMMANAEDIVVSWASNGVLKATGMAPGSVCTVEWTHRLDQPFSSEPIEFEGIPVDSNGAMTLEIPMFFRVRVLPEGMVKIPAGINAGYDPDFGNYSVTNTTFYMDKFEVSKTQWDVVRTWAVTNGYSFAGGQGKALDHPVHTVNWYDCVKWCNARSEMEGRTPCYTVGGLTYKSGTSAPDCTVEVKGHRLPTIREWDYAARGGLCGRRFPWGDTIQHSRANYISDESFSYDTSITRGYHPSYATGDFPLTSPVGSFPANGYGLYDMAGNVGEWCWELSGTFRYVRGGYWYNYANFARCGKRYEFDPVTASSILGFRTVCR